MYYNSVQVKGLEHCEQSLSESIARKMNSWGDSLLEPARGNYGGRIYTVTVSQNSVTIDNAMGKQKEALSLLDKVSALIGIFLKKLAHVNSGITLEDKAAFSGDKTHFFAPIKKEEKAKAETGYPPAIEGLGVCLLLSCMFCCAMCQKVK